jgi:hypothetical protein
MSLITEYKAYLQNNPEGYWFKRKLYGFGWIPATTQGWGVLGVYVFFIIGLSLWAESNVADSQSVTHVIAPMLLVTLLLLVIIYKTGEPLKWQWGNKDGK